MKFSDLEIMDKDEIINENCFYHQYAGFRPDKDRGIIFKPTELMIGYTVGTYCWLYSARHTFLKQKLNGEPLWNQEKEKKKDSMILADSHVK